MRVTGSGRSAVLYREMAGKGGVQRLELTNCSQIYSSVGEYGDLAENGNGRQRWLEDIPAIAPEAI